MWWLRSSSLGVEPGERASIAKLCAFFLIQPNEPFGSLADAYTPVYFCLRKKMLEQYFWYSTYSSTFYQQLQLHVGTGVCSFKLDEWHIYAFLKSYHGVLVFLRYVDFSTSYIFMELKCSVFVVSECTYVHVWGGS